MNEVYVRAEDLNRWITKYFPNKDLISVDELIGCIEELDSEVERLEEKIEKMEQYCEDNHKSIW